jgi:hypothetical protein
MDRVGENRERGEAAERVGAVGYRREVRVLASSWDYRGQSTVPCRTLILRLL